MTEVGTLPQKASMNLSGTPRHPISMQNHSRSICGFSCSPVASLALVHKFLSENVAIGNSFGLSSFRELGYSFRATIVSLLMKLTNALLGLPVCGLVFA